MTFVSKSLAGIAAVSLLAAQPALAQVRSADSLPESQGIASIERDSAIVGQGEEIRGRSGVGIAIAIAVLIAVGLIVAGDTDEDSPG